jgi:hypothetical protein
MADREILEALVLSYIELVPPADKNGVVVTYRNVKFQDSRGNTFPVEVFKTTTRGMPVPPGFKPILLGAIALHIVRKADDQLELIWVQQGTPAQDYYSPVFINDRAFPAFIPL